MIDQLTVDERELIESLPAPPKSALIQASNVLIIEWLPADDRHTGRELHDWIEQRRKGWSAYFPCQSKRELIAAIRNAAEYTQESGLKPVLHIEAHGNEDGLAGPNENGGAEYLLWEELTGSLQRLNLATQCNLMIVVAACIGFAGILALSRGPRAPAIALVGPNDVVNAGDLLQGAKEFYRRLLDPSPGLTKVVESASRELGTVAFEYEPFAIMAYDAQVERLIRSLRPIEQDKRRDRLRKRMHEETNFSIPEIEARLAQMPLMLPWEDLQRMWDEMFMIDLYAENKEKFGLDWKAIARQVATSREA